MLIERHYATFFFFKGDFSLGLSAMKINESFPDHIIKKIKSFKNYKRKK